MCVAVRLQGLVLDVKGILGAETDVGSILAQMITPPAAAGLQQGTWRLAPALQLLAAHSFLLAPPPEAWYCLVPLLLSVREILRIGREESSQANE